MISAWFTTPYQWEGEDGFDCPRKHQFLGISLRERFLNSLLSLWPKYLGLFISFLSIGSFWLIHHRQYRHIEQYDTRLMFINLLVLMSVAFIPFSTAVISENGNRTATILYALNASLVGFLSTWLWVYASYNRRLVKADLNYSIARISKSICEATMIVD